MSRAKWLPWHTIRYMTKWYNGSKTNGMSLAEVGQYLVDEAGFSPETHCVLAWYTSADTCVFRRVLLRSQLILDSTLTSVLLDLHDSDGHRCLQPFNLTTILCASSDLESVALSYVHRSLIEHDNNYQWHLPEFDCLGMAEMLRMSLLRTASRLEEQ